MHAIKDFFLDFWRELIFGILIILCLLLYIGFRNRGSEIDQLKTEVANLRNNSSQQTTTEQQDDSSQNSTDQTEEESSDYQGFNLSDNNDWDFTSGDAQKGYTFKQGSIVVDVVPKAATTEIASDIVWIGAVEDGKIKLTDDNENLCQQGQANCTNGDGRLQIYVKVNNPDDKDKTVYLFMTNDAYAIGDNSFSKLKEFIATVEI